MNKNHIRPTSTNLDVQSFIRRCEIAYDERARYVEFVCNVWNEGRFGTDLAAPVTVNFGNGPESELPLFSHLRDEEPNVPATRNASSFLGRAAFPEMEAAFERAVQMGLIDAGLPERRSPAALTPNQGRGSP